MIRGNNKLRFLFSFLLFFILILSVPGLESAESNSVDDLIFKVAVFGPSDEIFIWWGHAALIVENTRWNYSRVFDWGIFDYPSDNFLKDFVRENVHYKVTTGGPDFESYIKEDRDITVYTLNLDRKAKEKILSYADNKVLPENCYYNYHEFRDNCATGVRDIIDLGLGGQLKAAFSNVPGRFSYRQHILRYTWFRPLPDWFLGFLMGQNLDEEITPWEEMFLPVEIGRYITDFSYKDDSSVDRKLVNSVQVIYSSKNRQPILTEPLTTWPFALTIGLIAMALLLLVKTLGKKYLRTCRVILGLSHIFLGLVLGGASCVLAFGFTMNNDYFQQNTNILFVNPLYLALAPLGILLIINKQFRTIPGRTVRIMNAETLLRIFWTYVFIAGNITVLIRVLPFFYQQNQSVQGFVLPIAFALSCLPEKIYRFCSQRLCRPNV